MGQCAGVLLGCQVAVIVVVAMSVIGGMVMMLREIGMWVRERLGGQRMWCRG